MRQVQTFKQNNREQRERREEKNGGSSDMKFRRVWVRKWDNNTRTQYWIQKGVKKGVELGRRDKEEKKKKKGNSSSV